MLILLEAAIAPAAVGAVYIYVRDKYEKEPVRLLLTGVLFGIYATAVIWAFGTAVEQFFRHGQNLVSSVLFNSFISSAGVEEIVKYVFVIFLTWKNKNFNEWFDGIVYSVFICLGFAGAENIIYVLNQDLGGMETALYRAFFSVPGHIFFGVAMGYYLALAKFQEGGRIKNLLYALFVPWLLHGIYNMILLGHNRYYMFFLLPFVVYLWFHGFKNMKTLVERSPFK